MATVTLDAAKFTNLFTSIERNLIMQSSFLESMYHIQSHQVEVEKEREETRRREFDILSARMEEQNNNRPPPEPAPDATPEEKPANFFGKLFGFLLGGFELFKLKSILGVGLAVALADPISKFLKGAIGTALENAGVDQQFAQGLGDALGRAGAWATIGSVFGKKAALLAGIAGAGSSIFEAEINKSFDQNKDGIATAFGVEMSPEVVTGIGTAMGIGSAAILQYGPVQSKLLMGVSMLLGAYGDTAAKWLEEKTNGVVPADFTSKAVDAFTMAAYGASIGAMFGPWGAIIGGIAGFAISAGNSFYEWVTAKGEENRKANLARLSKEFEDAQNEYQHGDTGRGAEAMTQTAIEDIGDVASGIANEDQTKRIEASIAAQTTVDPERAKALQLAYDRAKEGVRPQEYGDQLTGDRNLEYDNYITALKNYLPNSGFVEMYAEGGGSAESAVNQIVGDMGLSSSAVEKLGEDRTRSIVETMLANGGIMPITPKATIVPTLSATESSIISKIEKMKQTGAPAASSAPIIAGSGNTTVNRQGDNHSTQVTNIYGTNPSASLAEGNSVPMGGR